ncbi:MAG TPA: PIG-L family deacetylase [Burkholderiaceae bacterium]|nr:PIG-L family deacetylase [Burkholderiaceae bacterium]
MNPVLVIAAHPDDEVLGAGGTIARLAGEGCAVHVLILGEGATSRHAERGQAAAQETAALTAQSRRAGELLGTREVSLCGLPDNRFDTIPLLEVIKLIELAVSRVRPEMVFTQHGGDLNVDHAITFRAALTAVRPLPGSSVRALYGFEVNSSTEWAFQQFTPLFRPSVFFDITETLGVKLAALAAYEGELRDFPHPRSHEAVTAQARRWGSVVGCAAAEAFCPVFLRQ